MFKQAESNIESAPISKVQRYEACKSTDLRNLHPHACLEFNNPLPVSICSEHIPQIKSPFVSPQANGTRKSSSEQGRLLTDIVKTAAIRREAASRAVLPFRQYELSRLDI